MSNNVIEWDNFTDALRIAIGESQKIAIYMGGEMVNEGHLLTALCIGARKNKCDIFTFDRIEIHDDKWQNITIRDIAFGEVPLMAFRRATKTSSDANHVIDIICCLKALYVVGGERLKNMYHHDNIIDGAKLFNE